jgi:DNA-binding FrmR family transcriptional regulator
MQIDEEERMPLQARLSRIEGQLRGLQRMVEEDRYCGDILDQVHSVQQALKSVGRKSTRNHLETCVTDAIRHGDEDAAEETYDEIMGLLEKELSWRRHADIPH